MSRAIPSTKLIGLIVSVIVAAATLMVPLPGELPPTARQALAVTLFAVVWWVFGVTHPAYTTFLLLLGYVLPGLAPTAVVFGLWTSPLAWLMIGAFLIAGAVTRSGLARRIALFIMLRYARSYVSIVILGYVLGAALSLLIPQPFPRTLLIMAIVSAILDRANAVPADRTSIGFSVFAAACATSMFFLTGDAVLNVAAANTAGVELGWLAWAGYMAVPALIASLLMLGLHFLVFRQAGPIVVDQGALRLEQQALGPMQRAEWVTLIWVGLATLLWLTDSLHHINPAWVALGAAVGLALPYIGEVLGPEDLSASINWPIVIFVVGALAIGSVATETGLAAWLAAALLPASPPGDATTFAALAAGVAMAIRMVLGSALASISIVAPPLVNYAQAAGWNPIFPALVIYTSVMIHFIFPFQHVIILLGVGETGRYGPRETFRYGLPLTLVTLFVIVVVEVTWWKLIGLVP